jgi:hypothetical protein
MMTQDKWLDLCSHWGAEWVSVMEAEMARADAGTCRSLRTDCPCELCRRVQAAEAIATEARQDAQGRPRSYWARQAPPALSAWRHAHYAPQDARGARLARESAICIARLNGWQLAQREVQRA